MQAYIYLIFVRNATRETARRPFFPLLLIFILSTAAEHFTKLNCHFMLHFKQVLETGQEDVKYNYIVS